MSEPLRVVATLFCKAGQGDVAAAAARDCVRATREEAGCLEYAAYRTAVEPDRITFVELWQSQSALDAHNATAHVARLVGAVETLAASPLEVLVLQEI